MVRKKAIKRVVLKILLFTIGTIIFGTPFIPVLIIYVLKAIGLNDELANSALRITFGDDNTREDVDYLIDNLHQSIKCLKNLNLKELQ